MSTALMTIPSGGNTGLCDTVAGNCPKSLHVVGRSPPKGNEDICGEYWFKCFVHGRAAYQKRGSQMAIRYEFANRRWMICREGFNESSVCVAHASDTVNSMHPACVDLLWSVWDPVVQQHVPDIEVAAVDAPKTIMLLGRCSETPQHVANGCYELFGLLNSRPTYMHSNGTFLIQYANQLDHWTLLDTRFSLCVAVAHAAGTMHPGCLDLVWQTAAAPRLLHVRGRAVQAANYRINGEYHVAGIYDGRPFYSMAGTRFVLRYSAASDRWLLDCDGLCEQRSSIFSPSYWYNRLVRGDAEERCVAYAAAQGAQHPGQSALQWHVCYSSGQYQHDSAVIATTAPLSVEVVGRDPSRDNYIINGQYLLVGGYYGRPAYQKPGSRFVLCFYAPMSRWMIRDESVEGDCAAWAHSDAEAEHPLQGLSSWYVHEPSRGVHFPDDAMRVLSAEEVVEGSQVMQPHRQQVPQHACLQEQALLKQGGQHGGPLRQVSYFGA